MAHVLSQIFTMSSNVDYVYIRASDHPGRGDDIDNTEWLVFFHLLINVEMLRVSGCLERQVAHALEGVPGKMVSEVLPSLYFLILEDDDELVSAE